MGETNIKAASNNTMLGKLGKELNKYVTVYITIILVILFSFLSQSFMTVSNWSNILIVQVVVGCLSLGALFPLAVGEFDLSLGQMLGFCMMLGAFLAEHGVNPVVIMICIIVSGVLAGLLNGILTTIFKISSFIATLGVGIILGGITLALSGGQVLFNGIPQSITTLGQGNFIGIGYPVWMLLIISVILFYLLEHTPLGRYIYAVGGSVKVSFLAGISTNQIKILSFMFAGLLTGIGALFQLGQAGAANPAFGPDLLMPAYAAVFLGVTTYKPGYFNIPGTIIALILLGIGYNGLSLLGAPFWAQPIFNGAVLVLAVLMANSEGRNVKVS
ncbi:MAG: ABC transporter permease [Ruminiclostridium sp.]